MWYKKSEQIRARSAENPFKTYIPSQRVHNFDLADKRRTWLTLSGLIAFGGILLFGFAFLSEQQGIGSVGAVRKTVRPRRADVLGDNAGPVTVFTTLDATLDTLSEPPEAPVSGGIDEEAFDRLCDGEQLPPKYDERGRPLPQGGFAAFLRSE